MNISGIRPVSGFYDYNSITEAEQTRRLSESAEAEEVSGVAASGVTADATTAEATGSNVSVADTRESASNQSFGAYDYARQYDPNATYDMKGADSDLDSLDVRKAVSDMQKDALLHQYQYFVGKEFSADAAGTARTQMENFSL